MSGDPWRWSAGHPVRAALIFWGSATVGGEAASAAIMWPAWTSHPVTALNFAAGCLAAFGGSVLGAYTGLMVVRRLTLRRKPKFTHPCPVCERAGREYPHGGQHPVRYAPGPQASTALPPPPPGGKSR